MSYYFLIPFLAVCIIADFIIVRWDLLRKARPGTRMSIILAILNVPLLWLLMKLDSTFHPLSNFLSLNDHTVVGLIIKAALSVVVILFLEVVLYRSITRLGHATLRNSN